MEYELLVLQRDYQPENCDRHIIVTRQAVSESNYKAKWQNEYYIYSIYHPHI
jgi:hypothetical protein